MEERPAGLADGEVAAALARHRLRWDLADLAEFLAWFRGPHERSADAETAWRGLTDILDRLAAA